MQTILVMNHNFTHVFIRLVNGHGGQPLGLFKWPKAKGDSSVHFLRGKVQEFFQIVKSLPKSTG